MAAAKVLFRQWGKRSEAKHFTPGESADTPLGPGVVSYQVESPTPTLEDTELRLTTDASQGLMTKSVGKKRLV